MNSTSVVNKTLDSPTACTANNSVRWSYCDWNVKSVLVIRVIMHQRWNCLWIENSPTAVSATYQTFIRLLINSSEKMANAIFFHSLRKNFKPRPLPHLCTPGQTLGEVRVNGGWLLKIGKLKILLNNSAGREGFRRFSAIRWTLLQIQITAYYHCTVNEQIQQHPKLNTTTVISTFRVYSEKGKDFIS